MVLQRRETEILESTTCNISKERQILSSKSQCQNGWKGIHCLKKIGYGNPKVDVDHFEHENIDFELNSMGIAKFKFR